MFGLNESGQTSLGGAVIGVIVAGIMALIGIQIFQNVNVATAQYVGNNAANKVVYVQPGTAGLFDLVPLLIAALVLVGIVILVASLAR